MTAIPQPTTEAGVQALVDGYNHERAQVRARAIQAAVLIILGFVIGIGSSGQLVVFALLVWLLAIIRLATTGPHSRRARDLRLQARLAADAAGVTIQE